MAVMYPFVTARFQGQKWKHWNQLGQAPRELTLVRTDRDTLRLEATQGVVESSIWLFRSPDDPWPADSSINKDNLQVDIVEVDNNTPTVIDFRPAGLVRGGVCLVRADGFLLKELPVPAVGQRVTVPWIAPQ